MKYTIVRTDMADIGIRKIVMYIARNFENDVALQKLDYLEHSILLAENPYLGITPKYRVLKRQGYRILILDKDIVFYKIDESKKEVIIYAVVDSRQDYLSIIQGL